MNDSCHTVGPWPSKERNRAEAQHVDLFTDPDAINININFQPPVIGEPSLEIESRRKGRGITVPL